MEPKKRRRPVLLGLAVVAVAAAAILPQTRWLLRRQALMQIAPGWGQRSDPQATARVLAENPADLPIQIAGAVNVPSQPYNVEHSASITKTENLRALETRFPNAPSIFANELRYMTMGAVMVRREEQNLLFAKPQPFAKSLKPITPENLAEFDRACAEGERLDPDNAYFPLMRSIGLFQAQQDEDAVAALHRAAEKTEWREYYTDEADGQWRLTVAAYQDSGALTRMAQAAAILFPHYAQIRSVARLATAKAVEAELAGRTQDGLALRHDVMRFGELLRAKAPSLIGSLVGIACANIATQRPGGDPAVKHDDNGPVLEAEKDRRQEERRQRYYAYLRSIGATEEAHYAEAELEAGKSAKAVLNTLYESDEAFGLTPATRLAVWEAADAVPLASALTLLVLGGAAGLAARINLKRRRGLARFLFASAILGGLVFWQWHVSASALNPVMLIMQLCGVSDDGSTMAGWRLSNDAVRGTMVTTSLAIPMLIVMTLGMISLVCRVPVGTGVGRGLRGIALPVAGLLLLVHVGLLFPVLRQEARVHHILDKTLAGEGRYLSGLSGKAWPDLTR